MTLIVYNKGTLAADSRETMSELIFSEHSNKLYKFKEWVLAAAGSVDDCAWFNEWMRTGFTKAPPMNSDGDAEGILLNRKTKKVYRCFVNGIREELNNKYPYIIGAGVFTGAMMLIKEFNMKPKEVIKMISKYNITVNSRVTQVKVW